jgi:xanthine/CO dehydrogenase XdhC/CoxF family maturation factor
MMPTIPQRDLYRMINEAAERGERVVVATVAHTRGSTPQATRREDALLFKTAKCGNRVGGGCIEAEVWAEAQTRNAFRRVRVASLLVNRRRSE